ncbi:MAG: hypothetical protein JXB62_10935 [Pirellulales bacterium]|nr:hypothetical protein [Pirellulales bacterium]
MRNSPATIGLAVVATALATGCSSSPWSAGRLADSTDPSAAPPPVTTQAASQAATQAAAAEMQRLAAADPAAGQELMGELQQLDPELWPLALHTRQAMEAYRQQAQQREQAAGRQQGFVADAGDPGLAAPLQDRLSAGPAARQPFGGVPGETGPPAHQAAFSRPPWASAAQPPMTETPAYPSPQPLPPPTGHYPNLASPSQVSQLPAAGPAACPPAPAQAEVVGASYNVQSDRVPTTDWQGRLTPAIDALQAEIQQLELPQSKPAQTSAGPSPAADALQDKLAAKRAKLNMLQLLAGRRDEALRPIASLEPAAAEFWSKQLHGLDIWLDVKRNPDAMRRAAEAKRELDEADTSLGELASLVVRRLAFSHKVDSFGCYEEFKGDEFVPGQEVLLYAEVENATPQPTDKGFHTSLQSSYEIFNNRGQRVDFHDFTGTEEYCRNRRRDFFIPYHLRLPPHILPGTYTLKLTVEDVKSQKVGQSSIELTIRGKED